MKKFECNYTFDDGEAAHWTGTVTPIRKTATQIEAKVEGRGSSYHIIIGRYSYGNYLCIPEADVGCRMADWNDVFWNREKLSSLINVTDAVTIVNGAKALMGDQIRTRKHGPER